MSPPLFILLNKLSIHDTTGLSNRISDDTDYFCRTAVSFNCQNGGF